MDKKKLISSMSAGAKQRVGRIFGNNNPRKNLFYRIAAEIFTEESIADFEEFIYHPGFRSFIKTRLRISPARLENTLARLLMRIVSGMRPGTIALIAERMSSKGFHNIEYSFYRVPVDRDGYQLFERGFIRVGEQNIAMLDEYIQFCSTAEFVFMKGEYRPDLDLYAEIFGRITDLILAKKRHSDAVRCAGILVKPHITRFMNLALDTGDADNFIINFFDIFYRHPDPDLFFELINIFNKRYRAFSEESERLGRLLYKRLIEVWFYFFHAQREHINYIKDFLNSFGNTRDEFERFVWDIVFSLEQEKAVRAMAILVSTPFQSLKGFYSYDIETIKFLTRNIIAAIIEMDIKDIGGSLYRIVLKLFLGLKIDRLFMKRRADFFSWMKKRSSSVRLEIEVIRFMFFEYMYIALRLVENTRDMRMTMFCDENHKYFCHIIDDISSKKFLMRRLKSRDQIDPYEVLLAKLRTVIWEGHRKKFSDYTYKLSELIDLAENSDREDQIISALENVEPEHFTSYHSALMEVFRENPFDIDEAIRHDYWHRVAFATAHPYCQGVLFPLVGSVHLEEGGDTAYTDGRRIYLPSYLNYFKDPLDPIIDNRNLTAYIGLTMHEAGHILAGSYHFNRLAYLNKLERPDLFNRIYNVFEDFRIELFMIRIRAHYQVKEIFDVLNEYNSAAMAEKSVSSGFDFLIYIFDEAGGYNRKLKRVPGYMDKIEKVLDRDLNTGRFRDMKTLAEYGIGRLRSLDVGNPISVFPLAREFYEIMKHWPERDLIGMADLEARRGPSVNYGGVNEDAPAAQRPLTREELDQLYREYNENPRAFLERHNIPVFPELFAEDGGDEASGETAGGDSGDGRPDNRISEFMRELLDEDERFAYEEAGTIDLSTRTKADEEAARRQVRGETDDEPGAHKKKKGKKRGEKKTADKKRTRKHVYSINPETKSRTRLSEIREYPVNSINRMYMKLFKRWEYLSDAVYRQLSHILPTIEEEHDISAHDGEMDIELLIDILSDKKNLPETPEIFDIYKETRRSLEVVIGLDASGSTYTSIEDCTILDIEKAFAIILGRALQYLTERVSVYAFNSLTSTNVYRALHIDAVSSFASDAANRDGDFIRYITGILEKSDAEVKYFFLLSDGQPASDNYTGKEALDDTLIAMRECVNSGIKLIYFNCDVVRGEYFELFQREATFARYFTRPDQMLPVIPGMVTSIVDSVR